MMSEIPIQETDIDEDGRVWTLQQPYDSDWLDLGICPKPTSVWRVMLYHFCHGMLMQYPLIDILIFTLRNRDAFTNDPPVINVHDGSALGGPYSHWYVDIFSNDAEEAYRTVNDERPTDQT